MVGQTLGHYELLELLGAGGMGEVYRARDKKLDRDVALKVLSEEFAADRERLARFEREARLLAALNHPNIAAIHALEEANGAYFLVLELVKGESLAQRIGAGPLPVKQGLELCKQVAEALEAAHGEGIIHRDLKPANVLITPEGRAKVLDFGIAKKVQVTGETAERGKATDLTVAGTLIGTPSYMSPEQMRGEPIDKRSDNWAFGCLLYEVLAGKSAFGRETFGDTFAAIVEQEPDWGALPTTSTERVRPLLERCLRKDTRRRLRDIGDAWLEIDELLAAPTAEGAGARTHIGAGIPLLETKLYIPKWRAGLVSRPRLIERLDQGIERKLTLVSAPAGFGKTTLLAEWLAATRANERAAGWVSLDQNDNDPRIFWAYFIGAVQKVESGVGQSALSLLRSPQPPPIESVLTTLINETNAIDDDFALVLDDFHVIDAQPVHSAIAFLLDHLPPRMHLVIASRSDPPLPLARLRGRGESTELRVSDLRFTADEAAAFLHEAMGLDLSAADVAALETRTEGWIAGLQLAALSMRGREDIPGFVAAFSGDDRYVVDYLVEEVLQRQPERVRSFLLQTSILDRLFGPLCDAVTGQEDSRGMLEALDRGNLFIVPLDDQRQWYRYHHLFADVLQARSMEEQPDQVPSLHRRASEWYEQNGLPLDAMRHALDAEDFERAAVLIELAWAGMHRSSQETTWLGWVEALPDELVRARPVLSVGYAFALLNAGELEAAETRLRDAERWLEPTAGTSERAEAPSVDMVVVDEKEFRSLPALIATARAFHTGALGDVPATLKHARRALDLLQEDDYYDRGGAATLLGLAYWASGDLEAAHRTFADGVANIRMAGSILVASSATYILAEIRVAQGRLHEAASTYEQSLRLAEGQGDAMPLATAILYRGLSEIHRERGDLGAAAHHQLRSKELGERAGIPGHSTWCVSQARLKEAQGDLGRALDLLDDAERLRTRTPVPDVRPIAALKARVWIVQGRLGEALDWAREQGLSVEDDLSYLREFEHITLARLLIARHRSEGPDRSIQEAMELLERLLKAAEEGDRTGSVIEILLLQALAHDAQGEIQRALEPLERALTLAEPEGYCRIFADEGEAMRDLLRHAAADGIAGSYTRRLLSAFEDQAQPVSALPVEAAELVVQLTARELEVLRLIAAGMRNQEIADQLFISLATVKRHIANAYNKLDVGHRTEAVVRATELKLL